MDKDDSPPSSSKSSISEVFVDASEKLPSASAKKKKNITDTKISPSSNETEEDYEQQEEEDDDEDEPLDPSFLPDEELAELQLPIDLEQVKLATDLFLNSDFDGAETMLRGGYKRKLYFTHGYAVLMSIKSILTFEPADIAKALSLLKTAVKVAHHYRKRDRSLMKNIQGFVRGHSLDDMTVLQRHAELIYAEAYLLKALISILHDEGLFGIVKESVNIRFSYVTYKQCISWLDKLASKSSASTDGSGKKSKSASKSKTNINSSSAVDIRNSLGQSVDPDFISGVRFGYGIFNLILSLMPMRALKVFEIIGFDTSRENALFQLTCEDGAGGLRKFMCDISLIAYNTLLSQYVTTIKPDLELSRKLIQKGLDRYPVSSLYSYFAGREQITHSNIKAAIPFFLQTIKFSKEWVQLHHICHWENAICYISLLQFSKASECIHHLQMESRWSKAVYFYLRAIHMYMAKKYESNPEDYERLKQSCKDIDGEIERLLEQVPEKLQRIAGRRMPVEKFVARKARKFFMQGKRLHLPTFEMMMVWNSYERMSPDILNKVLQYLFESEKELMNVLRTDDMKSLLATASKSTSELNQKWPYPTFVDDVCLNKLLIAIVQRALGKDKEALDSFEHLKCIDKHIQLDHYMAPFARYEYGKLLVKLKDYKNAKRNFESVQKDYKKYSLENSINLRVHNALVSLKEITKESQEEQL